MDHVRQLPADKQGPAAAVVVSLAGTVKSPDAVPATSAIISMHSILHLLQLIRMLAIQHDLDSQNTSAASRVLWQTALLASRLRTSEASVCGTQAAGSTSVAAKGAHEVAAKRLLFSAVIATVVPVLKCTLKYDASQSQTAALC